MLNFGRRGRVRVVDVRQLRYFVSVVEKGSFTRASEALGITQPSLGFQIRKIEEELKVQVLVRNSRGVQLTEPGRILYERGKRIIADMDDLRRSLSDLSEEPHGPVSLGITPSLADRILVPLIKQVRSSLPAIDLNVTEDMSQNLIDLLEVGRLDLALVFNAVPARGLSVRKLAEDTVFLVYRTGSEVADYSPVSFEDMAGFPLVLPRRPHRLRHLIDDAAQDCGIKLNIIAEMQSLSSILRMVDNGLGATLISSSMTRRNPSEGTLVTREVVRPRMIHDISIAHLDSRPLSRGASAVSRIVDQIMETYFT